MKKLNTLILLVSIYSTTEAKAMGSKRPKPNPSPPVSTEPPKTVPKVTTYLGPSLESDTYLESASISGNKIDQYMGLNELLKTRSLVNEDKIDKCFGDGLNHETFSDQISYYVQLMMENVPAKVGVIGSYYGTSSNDENYFPVSLIRHPLCSVSKSTLSTTIGSKVPDTTTINRMNRFASSANKLRKEIINGDLSAKKALQNLWTSFYSCLAYTESLPTADSSKSNSVAGKYSPANFRKPAGVEFYEDPSQSAESRLNIGMYQFTPSASNNIQPCLRAWNEVNKNQIGCQINLKASQSELIKVVGSSIQSFNAFCGIHKMLQTFSIQVNTTKSSATHPNNIVNGKFLGAEERCVSPHFKAGSAYVHFGPFMNSTGSNLSEIFSCIDKTY